METTPIIKMRGISKRFGGIQAVRDINLDIFRGEVLGIVGGNGAGKSTLIKILSGAYTADTGEIYYQGKRINITNPRHAKSWAIETIYQHLALADNMNVPENIFLGRELTNRLGILNKRAMEIEARAMVDRLKLKIDSFKTKVRHLSGGQRQCVAINRAIYFQAKILIMDEPTASLGIQETEMVHELVGNLKKEGIAIILISHDLHDVFKISERIAVLKHGLLAGVKKTKETTKDEILSMIIMGK